MDDGCEMTYRCLACCVVHGRVGREPFMTRLSLGS